MSKKHELPEPTTDPIARANELLQTHQLRPDHPRILARELHRVLCESVSHYRPPITPEIADEISALISKLETMDPTETTSEKS